MNYSRAAFLSSVLCATAGLSLSRLARAQGTKLRIAAPVSDLFAEAYYLRDAGTFAKLGYDIEVSSLSTPSAVAAAIAGGAIDLGIADLVNPVAAILKGVPLQLIAGGGLYQASNPFQVLAVAKDGPLKLPGDIEGRTVALPQLGGIGLAALRAWMAQKNVDGSKVKIVELTQSSMTAALLRGTIDAGVIGEPYLVPNLASIRDIGHPLDAIAKEFLVTGWYAQPTWVAQDPNRARHIIAAIYDTARWANAHRTETLAILAREGKLELDKVTEMRRAVYATSLTPSLIQPVLDIGTQFKLFDRPVEAKSLIESI
jgi:NitT/TauT family transport system substrate-binding protein